jgi:hypothetical protein
LLRQWRQHLAEAIGAGGIAAEHGEAMAGLQQLHCGLQTNARVATGEQHVPRRAWSRVVVNLLITISSHDVRL